MPSSDGESTDEEDEEGNNITLERPKPTQNGMSTLIHNGRVQPYRSLLNVGEEDEESEDEPKAAN